MLHADCWHCIFTLCSLKTRGLSILEIFQFDPRPGPGQHWRQVWWWWMTWEAAIIMMMMMMVDELKWPGSKQLGRRGCWDGVEQANKYFKCFLLNINLFMENIPWSFDNRQIYKADMIILTWWAEKLWDDQMNPLEGCKEEEVRLSEEERLLRDSERIVQAEVAFVWRLPGHFIKRYAHRWKL